jgi:NTE family protein
LADPPQAVPGVLARLRDVRLHMIGAEEEFRALKGGSRQDPTWAFLQEMRELGHVAADRWLTANRASIGVRSTVDLSEFAGPVLEPRVG